MQDTTGVVYATSFPALDAAIAEVSKFFRTQTVQHQEIGQIVDSLRSRLISHLPVSDNSGENSGEKGPKLSVETEAALENIRTYAEEVTGGASAGGEGKGSDESGT